MLDFFISTAQAQDAGANPQGNPITSILFLVVFFGIMWLLIIRPQQKRLKEHQALIAALSKGDEVVTSGGVVGKITGLDENFVSIEVADGMTLNVQRSAIANVLPKGTIKSLKK